MPKQTALSVHCIFSDTGEDAQQLILHSFVVYVRRLLAESGVLAV